GQVSRYGPAWPDRSLTVRTSRTRTFLSAWRSVTGDSWFPRAMRWRPSAPDLLALMCDRMTSPDARPWGYMSMAVTHAVGLERSERSTATERRLPPIGLESASRV